MPYKNKAKSKERPVIVVDKNKLEEFVIVPAYSKKRKHTTEYNKNGIKCYGHDLFVTDNENKPIKLNNKFVIDSRCSKIPVYDSNRIKDKVLNHCPQSKDNRIAYDLFLKRHKKK